MSFASNGLAAKARAIYGKHLGKEDYEEMLKKQNVSDVANYLKNNTYYSNDLKDVKTKTIHRGQLETILNRASFFRKISLHRYSGYKTKEFYDACVDIIDVDQILACVRALQGGSFEGFIAELPLFLNEYTSFDLSQLMNVRSLNDLKNLLNKTVYKDIANEYIVGNECDYSQLENAFKNFYYENLKEVIHKNFKGKVRQQLTLFVDEMIDLKNISKIYRMKRYFDGTAEDITKILIPCHSKLKKVEIEKMLNVTDYHELFPILEKSNYNIVIDESSDINFEHYLTKILFNHAKEIINFTTEPALIYLAFDILDDIEVKNIINIIEGVRYKVDYNRIQSLLIY